MTNLEKIKKEIANTKTSKKLAKFIYYTFILDCRSCFYRNNKDCEGDCEKGMQKYLDKEVLDND